ncbi:rhomboid family intramembrane serine protease [Motiliproteus sp. MSK22-1]|uniref:rhomboid family intramembrane serine protease n=1 Tax=Motiliproteus sp. MSK22-1 TaxID=1897630 RepID=UPI000975582C|nr:rhomboid family intramembrane serine protease [Motiliproteus sp. MSK22-1]OMH25842.1 hypothetical protein BGP75_25320 [Motiliproteus sp. MSK22-1]
MLKYLLSVEMLLIVLLMWAVFIIDFLLPGINLNYLGIQPRKIEGLMGILFSPFLHVGLTHIVFNSIPLLVLSALIRLSVGSSQLRTVIVLGIIASGFGTWVFSSAGVVVGASGLVYAFIGFLFADAYFNPSLRSWLFAIISFFLYGGAFLSLFVFNPVVSWAAHFWGFVAGALIASILRRPKTSARKSSW